MIYFNLIYALENNLIYLIYKDFYTYTVLYHSDILEIISKENNAESKILKTFDINGKQVTCCVYGKESIYDIIKHINFKKSNYYINTSMVIGIDNNYIIFNDGTEDGIKLDINSDVYEEYKWLGNEIREKKLIKLLR